MQAHHGIHSCNKCGLDFPGPTGASEYVAHICHGKDTEAHLRHRWLLEDSEIALCNAFGDMVDLVGLPSAMEALARGCESWVYTGGDCWQDVANALIALGEDFGKQGYGELER